MSLESHVKSFKIEAPKGLIVAGAPIQLTAVPTLPLLEVLTGPVSLDVLLKHVQLAQESGVAPWPAPAAATSVVSNVTAGLASSPAANSPMEGWAVTVLGTLPVGTRDLSGQVKLEFRWRFTLIDPEMPDEELAELRVIGGARTAPAITVTIPPVVTELTDIDFDDALANARVTRRLRIQISVTGTLGTETINAKLPDPPLELDLVAIPVPSVAALFNKEELTGPELLILVPDNSPFSKVATLLKVLSPLGTLLNTVKTAAATTVWAAGARALHTAVTALTDRIPLTKHVGFLARDKHPSLSDYNFIEKPWWPNDDLDDAASSILLVSATRAISFFDHDDFEAKELRLQATPELDLEANPRVTHFGGAVVRRLHVTKPVSTPPGCVVADAPSEESDGWGDIISSYQWGPPEEDN